jgi:hypothetical protein
MSGIETQPMRRMAELMVGKKTGTLIKIPQASVRRGFMDASFFLNF